jgi:hypothetical protein
MYPVLLAARDFGVAVSQDCWQLTERHAGQWLQSRQIGSYLAPLAINPSRGDYGDYNVSLPQKL